MLTLNRIGNVATIKTAKIKTIGVYILLIFDTTVSILVFLSVALSSNSMILETVESLNTEVAFIWMTSSKLMQPDNTVSLMFLGAGLDSPVSEEVSSIVLPSTIMPSTGIFSPFFTTRMSFTLTSLTSILMILLPSFLLAYASLMSSKFFIDFLELLRAFSSSILPIVYRVMTMIPSMTLPIIRAPRHDILIKAFSLMVLLLISNLMALVDVL